MNFILTCQFTFHEPLHLGTGLSQAGVADRTIGLDAKNEPILRGEAVKGAIRGSAERLLRWLVPQFSEQEEQDDHSLPPLPTLERIFRGGGKPPFYRFDAGVYQDGGKLQQIAATRIESQTGVAANQTLRILQSWTPGARFQITLRGFQGQWADLGHTDFQDLTLLLTALVCTDAIGGRKGSGHGGLQISQLRCDQLTLPKLDDPAQLEALKRHLLSEVPAHA